MGQGYQGTRKIYGARGQGNQGTRIIRDEGQGYQGTRKISGARGQACPGYQGNIRGQGTWVPGYQGRKMTRSQKFKFGKLNSCSYHIYIYIYI